MSGILGMLGGGAVGEMMDGISGSRNRDREHMRGVRNDQMHADQTMNKFNYNLEMKKWKETNFQAQIKEMKKAGLNVGMMYGGVGAGGQSTTGGQGTKAPSNPNQPQMMGVGMATGVTAMQTQANVELAKANAEKAKAETGITKGGKTEALDIENIIRKESIPYAKSNAESEALIKDETWRKLDWENQISKDTYYERIDKIKAEATNEKVKSRIMRAEAEVKEFEASMAREGIPPNSPWYAKMLGDSLNKMGILELIGKGKTAVKGKVKGN